MQRWYPDYQTRDGELVDYKEFLIRDCDVPFRGPGFDPFEAEQGSFFTCLGAAQTYGCYYEHPFPSLLSEKLGMPALNLAVGGTGPGFYLQYPSLIDAMNRGRFVVLQAMSARHERNSRFEPDGYVEFVKDTRKGDSVTSSVAWQRILREEPESMLRYIDETRKNWIETTRKLVERLTVPVIFFWFSRRQPQYRMDLEAALNGVRGNQDIADENAAVPNEHLGGDFPQYVDEKTARAAAELCDAYVECTSARGMGARLISRHTGLPVDNINFAALGPEFKGIDQPINIYYPSAEMHQDACAALLPAIRQVMGQFESAN